MSSTLDVDHITQAIARGEHEFTAEVLARLGWEPGDVEREVYPDGRCALVHKHTQKRVHYRLSFEGGTATWRAD